MSACTRKHSVRCVPLQKGVQFPCTVSVPSCDEAAPQSHEVFTHCALNPAMVHHAAVNVFQYSLT